MGGQGKPMDLKTLLFGALAIFLVCVNPARPGDPRAVLLPPVEMLAVQEKQPEKEKKEPDKKLTEPPKTDIFDPALLPRGDTERNFNPHMMGDQTGLTSQSLASTGTQTITVTTFNTETKQTTTTIVPRAITRANGTAVSIPTAGAFKIAENESPRPLDRVFFTYNYFS